MLSQTRVLSVSTPLATSLAARDFSRFVKESPRRRVLVVDDEPLVRWSVAETLGASGYEIVEAGDGDSAIRALVDRRTPDVVLLDLCLPDSDDLRVLAVMRRLAPATPIILMTAYATPELTEQAIKIGAFRVVGKPFEMNELVPLIEDAFLH